MQHDGFGHVVHLVLPLVPCDLEVIINGTTSFVSQMTDTCYVQQLTLTKIRGSNVYEFYGLKRSAFYRHL